MTFIIVVVALGVYAQGDKEKLEDGKWYLKGITGLNLSQTALSNWSAGGESSYAGNLYLNGTLNRKSGNWLWANALALDYGLTHNKTDKTRKVSDKIDFTSQLGYSTDNKWYYTLMGDFKSQFTKGYNYPNKTNHISNFLAPAYSNISLGLEYRPNQIYSIYLSPLAGKLTFVQDAYLSSIGAFGVDKGNKFRAELGAYFKARAQKKLVDNVEAITTLDFFTAYNKSFGNVDVNWDLLISMKINEFLSATVNTTLKYDDDIKIIENEVQRGAKVQFKEMFGLGLKYQF